MFERLISSYLEAAFPKELTATDLRPSSSEIRPRSVRLTCGAWVHLDLHTKCTDSRVQELQRMGIRVYPFTGAGRDDEYLWIEHTKLEDLLSICREYQFTRLLHPF
jgi:hypothetical protein